MERNGANNDDIPKPWLYDLGRETFRALSFASRITSSGTENIPHKGPVVFATTHRGFSDIPILGIHADGRRIRYIAKKDLFNVPLVRNVLTETGTIPVSRKIPGPEFFHRVISILRDDNDPAVFMACEGGVRRGTEVVKVQPGLGFIALFTELTIIPTAIAGPEKMPKSPLPNDSHIHFSEPLSVRPQLSYSPNLDLRLSNRNPLFSENTGFVDELSDTIRTELQEAMEIAHQKNAQNASADYFHKSLFKEI